MQTTLAITGPIYLVIGLGFFAVRLAIFTKADTRVLGTFVVKFALPALIFTSLSQRPVAEILNGRYLLDYALGSLAVMFAAFAWGWWCQGKSFTLSALCAAGSVVFEQRLYRLPDRGASRRRGARCGGSRGRAWYRVVGESLWQLTRNPIILAVVAGFCAAWLQIPVSPTLARTINMLAMSSTAVALFVIGGALVDLQVRGMLRDVSAIALGKLLLHPFAIGLLIWLLPPADPALSAAAVIYASVPMLSIYPILAGESNTAWRGERGAHGCVAFSPQQRWSSKPGTSAAMRLGNGNKAVNSRIKGQSLAGRIARFHSCRKSPRLA